MKTAPCVISVAEHAGWAHVVCVSAPRSHPVVVERRRITLIEPGLPTLPYHHDTIGMREDAANALLARVQLSVAACTSHELHGIVADLAASHPAVALAIREPTFPSLPRSVTTVWESYRLQCAADGVMYQLALCRAARDLGLEVHLCRRGQEAARAAAQVGVRPEAIEKFVTSTGRPAGPPWTQEHRRAYTAGIAVLAAYARGRLRIQAP